MTPWAKQKPNALRKIRSKSQKMEMETEKGMRSLNVWEMLGGTWSGSLMVMLRDTKNL